MLVSIFHSLRTENRNLCPDALNGLASKNHTSIKNSRIVRVQKFTQPLRIVQFITALIIFCYAALSPSPHLVGNHNDTSMHFVGNILLCLSAWVAVWGRVSITHLVLLLLPFSCAIELAQYFSPGRVVDAKDMLINIAGLMVGASIAQGLQMAFSRLLR